MSEVEEKVLAVINSFLKDSKNYKIEVAAACKPGDNWLGLVYTATITNNRSERDRLDLIVKLAPYQAPYRKVFPIRNIFEREIFIYDNVLTEFSRLQEEKGVTNIFQAYPRHHVTTMANGGEALIMDNMKMNGFITGNHKIDTDYPHALLVMREMGKFHAMSFALRDQKPNVYKHIEENCLENFFNSGVFESLINIITTLGNKLLETYDPDKDAVCIKILQNSINKVGDTFSSLLHIERYGEYAVVNHGDPAMRNYLFKYGDKTNPSNPTELCVIDYQLARIASPALDILWFIFVCTNQELRDLHYNDLLEAYYKSLSTVLRQIGSDPENLFPYNALISHLKEFSSFGLFMSIWVRALNTKESENIPDVYSSNEQLIVDEFAEAPLGEVYFEKIRGVVSDFFKYGYL